MARITDWFYNIKPSDDDDVRIRKSVRIIWLTGPARERTFGVACAQSGRISQVNLGVIS